MADYIGVLVGADGFLGTGDDIYVTSGTNETLVDALFGSGSGASEAAYCYGCTKAQEQAAIDDSASYPGFTFKVSGTYSIGSASGTGTFNVSPAATPEPSSFVLLGSGILGLAGVLRRRWTAH